MRARSVVLKLCVVLVCVSALIGSAWAIMPPRVYKEAIESSAIKAVAIVVDVETLEETKHYISKRVEFELVESYGELEPNDLFFGSCKSATESMLVGGTIYYYPSIGDHVFVTIDNAGEGRRCGRITSYTVMDKRMERVLKKKGLEGVKYGMGRVSID